MSKISAQIVADSTDGRGNRITTMMVTFPRFILAELNTHRMFSRNSASSRAIPFKKMVESVKENPFIPIAWQKDHKGMQGSEYLSGQHSFECTQQWLNARDLAIQQADILSGYEVTKQLCNRILEPFMWHTVLITATEWENFFDLRCPNYSIWSEEAVKKEGFPINPETLESEAVEFRSRKDMMNYLSDNESQRFQNMTDLQWRLCNKGQAEIHMMELAEQMWDAMNESNPTQLRDGEWHIPFGDLINRTQILSIVDDLNLKENQSKLVQEAKIKVATARCARVSYTVVGEEDKTPDYRKDIELHDRLLQSKHYSPFEHCARMMSIGEYQLWIKGQSEWNEGEHNTLLVKDELEGWCLNYRGFIQYRALI